MPFLSIISCPCKSNLSFGKAGISAALSITWFVEDGMSSGLVSSPSNELLNAYIYTLGDIGTSPQLALVKSLKPTSTLAQKCLRVTLLLKQQPKRDVIVLSPTLEAISVRPMHGLLLSDNRRGASALETQIKALAHSRARARIVTTPTHFLVPFFTVIRTRRPWWRRNTLASCLSSQHRWLCWLHS